MALRYNGFEIHGGQLLLLAFNEPDGQTTSLLWQVPTSWDDSTTMDEAFRMTDLDDVGLLIGGQENIFPDMIRLAAAEDQFLNRAEASGVQVADIRIGDNLVAVDPFVAEGATGPEYEIRFTVTEENSDLPGDQYIWLAPMDIDTEEFELYRA